MRTFPCVCGHTLFFASVRCVKCGRDTGMCSACDQVVAIVAGHCSNTACGVAVARCSNQVSHGFCNRLIPSAEGSAKALCDYCQLTTVTPDLSLSENIQKWAKLEASKQRVLYIYQRAGFPLGPSPDPSDPALAFQFKADGKQPVATGHAGGTITINIKEADSVEREKARVGFGEPQRTLVGHFRHELGHFVWERLVRSHCESACREIFGDERNPSYCDAMDHYYAHGPRPQWENSFISAYATMHPWEDFAETFGGYLDMRSVLESANHFGITQCETQDLDSMMDAYRQVGLIANEFNRDMGLLDLVPEVFAPPVIEKMRFVHSLRSPLGGQ